MYLLDNHDTERSENLTGPENGNCISVRPRDPLNSMLLKNQFKEIEAGRRRPATTMLMKNLFLQ